MSALFVLSCGIGLCLYALGDNIVYFYTPSDFLTKSIKDNTRIRAGGLVKNGSVKITSNDVDFVITDLSHEVSVSYHGILPDLFKEGQGVIVEGVFLNGLTIQADTILAKHDERYMPKQLADSLKQQGVWRAPKQDLIN